MTLEIKANAKCLLAGLVILMEIKTSETLFVANPFQNLKLLNIMTRIPLRAKQWHKCRDFNSAHNPNSLLR